MDISQYKPEFKPPLYLARTLGLPNQMHDRVKGVLLGLAAGDRIGGPTNMATLLGESLVEQSVFASEDVEEKYTTWWTKERFDVGTVNNIGIVVRWSKRP